MGQVKLLEKQQQAQGAQQHAHQAHQAVQVSHEYGLGGLDGLGLPDQAARVTLRAHPGQAVEQPALHQVTAGEQLVPGRFANGIALPGEQGFIGRALPFHHLAIGQDLIPRPGHHQVAQHQLLHAAGLFLALPEHPGRRGIEQLQPLQGALGPQLLHRTDQRIGKHHAQEQHVPVRPHQDQAGRQGEVEHIEQGKEISRQYLPHGLARVSLVPVVQAHFRPAGGFLLGQAGGRGGRQVLGRHGRNFLMLHGRASP